VRRDSAVNRLLMGLRPAKALMSTPDQGAEPLFHLATTPGPIAIDGAYSTGPTAKSPRTRRPPIPTWQGLWECSEQLTGPSATSRT
jgi:hypothetical protein